MSRLAVDIGSLDRAASVVEQACALIDPPRSDAYVDAGDSVLTAALRDFGRVGVRVGYRLREGGGQCAEDVRAAARVYRIADDALGRAVRAGAGR